MSTTTVQSIGNGCIRTEIIQIIEFRRLTLNRVILKNKIAQTVENRLSLIDLNASPNMRAMTDIRIGSIFQTKMSKISAEVSWQFLIHPLALM